MVAFVISTFIGYLLVQLLCGLSMQMVTSLPSVGYISLFGAIAIYWGLVHHGATSIPFSFFLTPVFLGSALFAHLDHMLKN